MTLDYEGNQPLCSYQIKHHQPSTKFFLFTASDTTSYSETTCIIKNKLNPAIMLYWDNQKSLLHFLPMPPSGRRLPECIFPMSSQPVSHRGGSRKNTQKRRTHTHEGWCNPERHQNQMLLLTSRLRHCRGRDALVTAASKYSGDSVWVSESVKGYFSRQADRAMENGVKGHRAGCGGYTHMRYNASFTLWHAFFFFPFLAMHMDTILSSTPFFLQWY